MLGKPDSCQERGIPLLDKVFGKSLHFHDTIIPVDIRFIGTLLTPSLRQFLTNNKWLNCVILTEVIKHTQYLFLLGIIAAGFSPLGNELFTHRCLSWGCSTTRSDRASRWPGRTRRTARRCFVGCGSSAESGGYIDIHGVTSYNGENR